VIDQELIQQNIEEQNWELASSEIICPYCGFAKDVDYEMYFGDSPVSVYEEGEELITCPECGHEFLLEKRIEWEYGTYVKE